MDIVYILGTGSPWQDNELRYSLRSIEKNILDLGNVFIVGERPEWLRAVTHIPCSDPYSEKWKNGYHKVSRACREPAISDEFLLMNDDFFILKPLRAEKYPFYHRGVLCKSRVPYNKPNVTSWQKTGSELMRQGKGVLSFNVHRPIRIVKELFLNMPKPSLDWLGFSPRAFYANYYGFPGVKCRDPIYPPSTSWAQFENVTAEFTDFTVFTATALSPVFRKWIDYKFPAPSQFEVTD